MLLYFALITLFSEYQGYIQSVKRFALSTLVMKCIHELTE